MNICHQPISGRSRFETLIQRRCFREENHEGKHDEYPYLHHLEITFPRVANKIKRDATKTTGAAWKSDDAGPNRADRWAWLLSDEELLEQFGINMANMKPTVRAKLREKAASYDDCMNVAAKLTWSVYQMRNAPSAPDDIKNYLETRLGPFDRDPTRCIVCRDFLDFEDFEKAQRGRALIETAHSNPRLHNADNVGFAHRECNIAQGGLSLSEFYSWIRSIITRVDSGISADVETHEIHNSTSFPKD